MLKNNNKGAIAILTVFLLTVLFGIAAILYFLSMHYLIMRELESAAESSAHAGAQSLNSTRQGFNNAKLAAINILQESLAHGGKGDNKLATGIDPSLGPIWDLTNTKNVKLTIERGLWDNQSATFTPLEDSWQSTYPGVPNFLAANAVRVLLQRPSTYIGTFLFGDGISSESSDVIAAASITGEVCVAPFAIPACSLLNESGDFNPETACNSDRLFTQTNRHCPDDQADCQNDVPSKAFGLCNRQEIIVGEAHLPNLTVCGNTHGWNTPEIPDPRFPVEPNGWTGQRLYPNVQDHFGVVGLPEYIFSTQNDFEGEIRTLLNSNPDTCRNATIGSTFTIASAGLTELATDESVWNRIASLGTQNGRPNDTTVTDALVTFGANDQSLSINLAQGVAASFPDTPGRGVCNTRWGNYSFLYQPGVTLRGTFNYSPVVNGTQVEAYKVDTLKLWTATIPIIANFSNTAGSCQGPAFSGTASTARDSTVDEYGDWRVIGFVKAQIYDVDIGQPPPVYLVPGYGDLNLGFKQACNVVRAKIDCSSRFIPAPDSVLKKTPIIVKRS